MHMSLIFRKNLTRLFGFASKKQKRKLSFVLKGGISSEILKSGQSLFEQQYNEDFVSLCLRGRKFMITGEIRPSGEA